MMSALPLPSDPALPISAVERDTGISKDTLRIWERRYGYPNPARNGHGERLYLPEHVRKLRVLRRLLDHGHRPGSLMTLPVEDLEQLAGDTGLDPAYQSQLARLKPLMAMLNPGQVDSLRDELAQVIARDGIDRFVSETVAPMNHLVGQAWLAGTLQIHEEHFYSETMQTVLRTAIHSVPRTSDVPRVLLATLPNEFHGLGLLMAEAILVLNGCRCLSLGTQLPVNEIVSAGQSFQADIVGLSITGAMNPTLALNGIMDLRAQLDPQVQIWCGGRGDALRRKLPKGVRYFPDLHQLASALDAWRVQAS